MARQPDGLIHGGKAKLPFEVIRQRLRLCQKVLERRLFENLGLARTGGAVVQVVIEALKIDIAIRIVCGFGLCRRRIDGLFDRDFAVADRRVLLRPCRRLASRQFGRFCRIPWRSCSVSLTLDDLGAFFEHRILNKFLLNHLSQLELVQRQQAHHLHETGGENLLLLDLEI